MRSVLDVYQSAVKQVLGGRELEAAVLQKAAHKMRSCRQNWDGSLSDALSQALTMNRAIWTVFQGELLDTNNPLPQPIRVNLLKLSRIVDRVTFEIMAEPEADKLELLIDINIGIAEGLLSGPGVYRAPQTLCA